MMQDDRSFSDSVDLLNEFAERKFGGDVQTDRRLIEKEHFRRVEHGRHKIAFYPLPEGHLPYRLVDDFFDPQDPVQHVQRPVIIRLPDLINMFEQFEALAKAQVPVELRPLPEHDADVPHHLFPVDRSRTACTTLYSGFTSPLSAPLRPGSLCFCI